MEKALSKTKERMTATTRMVRDDYARQPVLSYAECALIAGVSAHTITKWVHLKKIPVVNKRGAFRIPAEKFRKFLELGISIF